jgi:FkbM family methyltransferase
MISIDIRLKQYIIGTPFETIARRTYRFLKADSAAEDSRGTIYDQQAFAVMQRCLNTDSNCVDVGCHKGVLLSEILRFAGGGTHYAFEPIPQLYEELVLSFPNVKLYNLALSDTAGESTFQHVTSNSAYSGLKKRRYPRDYEIVEEIKVKTDLLDNIIPEDLPVSLIKIDVEGGELQVLRGALNTICRNRPVIIFEHGLGAADYYGTRPHEVYDFLTIDCKIEVSLMEDWLKRGGPLSRARFTHEFHQGLNFYFIAHPTETNAHSTRSNLPKGPDKATQRL